jgi:hypothetical protein
MYLLRTYRPESYRLSAYCGNYVLLNLMFQISYRFVIVM